MIKEVIFNTCNVTNRILNLNADDIPLVYLGIKFCLSKFKANGNVSTARQGRIEKIIKCLSEVDHRELRTDVKETDEDVEIVEEIPDPMEVYIVTDESNLLIFEQEINRYNLQNTDQGSLPPILYEQMSSDDRQSFYIHIVASDESENIFQQEIYEVPTHEEKEVHCIRI